MAGTEQEHWARVRTRLRAEVGDEIYTSWFARMDLETIEGETVKLSVPTRFLKSWIGSHYTEKVMSCWQAEQPAISRVEITVRSAVIRPLPIKTAVVESPSTQRDMVREYKPNGGGDMRHATAPISAVHEALGGSPLDPRLTFETFLVGRSNTLAHAAAKQVAQGRRGDVGDVQPALHSCRRRAGQNPSPAIARLGRERHHRAQGPLPDRREVHVRLRRGAARAECAGVQGSAARRSTCW